MNNPWCESCARKNVCYTLTTRPKCFTPITNTDDCRECKHRDKTMLYLVHFDGYLMSYGSENYLLGVYSSRKKAEEAVQKFQDDLKNKLHDKDADYLVRFVPCDVQGIIVDHTYKWEVDPDWYISTQIFLGGYAE